MSSLAVLRTQMLTALGTSIDDPLYPTPVLNAALIDACHILWHDIHLANQAYMLKRVMLVPDTASTWTYTFASNAVATGSIPPSTNTGPFTDFARWLEIRKTNDDGDLLKECKQEELRDAGNGYFCIVGQDDQAVLWLSKDTETGLNLFMQYTYWPADPALDTDVPGGIPLQYHDVLWLEAVCMGFGLGGESRLPPEIRERWTNRRAALFQQIGRRGIWPSRTRQDPFDVEGLG